MNGSHLPRLVYWQNAPSMHQLPLLEALADATGRVIQSVCEWEIAPNGLPEGWKPADSPRVEFIIAPDIAERQRLEAASVDAINIVTGVAAYPETSGSMRRLLKLGALVAVFSESGDPRGWRGLLRLWKYRWHAAQYRRKLAFILAVGQLGLDWYGRAGFDKNRMFEFGYFVAPSSRAVGSTTNKILFVGSLVQRKGLTTLLQALAMVAPALWLLEVIGEGPIEKSLKEQAARLGISDRVEWTSRLPNDEVRERIAGAAVLVLPSLFDGWGAVVSEALSAGTPVIVSDACGASTLVSNTTGEVFPAGNATALAVAISRRIATPVDSTGRERIGRWAADAITPSVAAAYLLDIVSFVANGAARPMRSPPWRLRRPLEG